MFLLFYAFLKKTQIRSKKIVIRKLNEFTLNNETRPLWELSMANMMFKI